MEAVCLTKNYAAETLQVVTDVFTSMLRLDVLAVPDPGPSSAPIITATVHFVGSWKGALRIECSPEQIFEYTHRLLDIIPTTVNEDACDAFGELANMIGGNLKPVLPHPVHLYMPSVVRGVDYAMRICQTVTNCRLAFDSDLGIFWVTLVEFIEP